MHSRITLLKYLDSLVGQALTCILPWPLYSPSFSAGTPRKILVIRPGGIGDAVLLLPMIRLLADTFPGICIDVVAERRNAGIFSLCSQINRIFLYDRPKDWRFFFRGGYDCVIDTEQWHRLSAVVARLVPSHVKVGFATNTRRRMFTSVVDYSHSDYEMNAFLKLIATLGVKRQIRPSVPFVDVPPTAVRRAAEILQGNEGRGIITLFPGATISERRWGRDRFAEAAKRLADRGYRIVVVGGGDVAAESSHIAAVSAGGACAGVTSLAETAAVILRSRLLISGDSGILHLAIGLGVPTVSLFGPGIQEKWGPRGDNHIIINKRLPCSPCTKFGHTPKCPHDARCMKEITVDEVEAAVLELLSRIERNKNVDTIE